MGVVPLETICAKNVLHFINIEGNPYQADLACLNRIRPCTCYILEFDNHLATEALRAIGGARELDQFPLHWLATLPALVQCLEVISLTDDLSAVQGVVH